MSRSESRKGSSAPWLIIRLHLTSGIHPAAGQCRQFLGQAPQSRYLPLQRAERGVSRKLLQSICTGSLLPDERWQRLVRHGLGHLVQNRNDRAVSMEQGGWLWAGSSPLHAHHTGSGSSSLGR